MDCSEGTFTALLGHGGSGGKETSGFVRYATGHS